MSESREDMSARVLRKNSRSGAGRFPTTAAAPLLDCIIFFSLIGLIVLSAIPYGTVDPWWEARFECAVFIIAMLWILEGLLSGSWRANGYSVVIPVLGLAVFALAQTLPLWGESEQAGGKGTAWLPVSSDPFGTLRFVFKLFALILLGVLLLRYTSSLRRLSALTHSIIALGVASALFGIVRQTIQRGADAPFAYLMPNEGYAQFVNRNHFAFLMEMALGLLFGIVVGGGVRRNRALIYLAAAIPMWAALVLSNSRGGIFSILSQVLFLALFFGAASTQPEGPEPSAGRPKRLWCTGRSLLLRIFVGGGLAAVLALGIVWMGGDPLASRFESVADEIGTEGFAERGGTSRREIWGATWQLIQAYPVTGVGFGGYWIAIPEFHNASGEVTPQEAHNDYLELLASGGIVGAAFAAWFVFAVIRTAFRRLRTSDSFRRAACFGALVGLFGPAVHSFVDFGLHVTVNSVVFTALVVIATRDGPAEGEVMSSGLYNEWLPKTAGNAPTLAHIRGGLFRQGNTKN